jgi:hypothetical protein
MSFYLRTYYPYGVCGISISDIHIQITPAGKKMFLWHAGKKILFQSALIYNICVNPRFIKIKNKKPGFNRVLPTLSAFSGHPSIPMNRDAKNAEGIFYSLLTFTFRQADSSNPHT